MTLDTVDGYCVREGDTVYVVCDGPQTALVTEINGNGPDTTATTEIDNLYGDGGTFTVEFRACDIWAYERIRDAFLAS